MGIARFVFVTCDPNAQSLSLSRKAKIPDFVRSSSLQARLDCVTSAYDGETAQLIMKCKRVEIDMRSPLRESEKGLLLDICRLYTRREWVREEKERRESRRGIVGPILDKPGGDKDG